MEVEQVSIGLIVAGCLNMARSQYRMQSVKSLNERPNVKETDCELDRAHLRT